MTELNKHKDREKKVLTPDPKIEDNSLKIGQAGSTVVLDDNGNEHWNKQNIIKLSLVALVAFCIGFIIFDYIKTPNTYDELLPLMDEAIEFDSKMNDYARNYEPIESQIDEDTYFQTIEEPYKATVDTQREVLAQMKKMDAEVVRRGGITNFEELQRIKQQPTDPYAAQQVEKTMKTFEELNP